MNNKWTKGPWVVNNNGTKYPGIDADDIHIVFYGDLHDECGVIGLTHEESFANANLIASAPDLYESLQGLLEAAEEIGMGETEWYHKMLDASAALAKARGGE